MSDNKKASEAINRRNFLRLAGAGGGAAAAALVVEAAPAMADEAPSDGKRGYAETEHVRAYYASLQL